jgi:predicted metal-dependent hydrolase
MENDAHLQYSIEKRDIKYSRIEYRKGTLCLILPKSYDEKQILEKHQDWISSKKNAIELALKRTEGLTLNDLNIESLKTVADDHAKSISSDLNILIGKLYFRKMRTKWASCSSDGNLTINTLCRYLPNNLIEYVIFHEIMHRIEKRHNSEFWERISSRYSDHNDIENLLFSYWFLVCKENEVKPYKPK